LSEGRSERAGTAREESTTRAASGVGRNGTVSRGSAWNSAFLAVSSTATSRMWRTTQTQVQVGEAAVVAAAEASLPATAETSSRRGALSFGEVVDREVAACEEADRPASVSVVSWGRMEASLVRLWTATLLDALWNGRAVEEPGTIRIRSNGCCASTSAEMATLPFTCYR
jgi:hypothetical protein